MSEVSHLRAIWITPAAPAALGIVALHGRLPTCFDRDWPAVGQHRFGRLLDANDHPVDEIVAVRLDEQLTWLCTHGGPGIRAAVSDLLTAHRYDLDESATAQEAGQTLLQSTPTELLAAASCPAATQWLLEQINRDASTPIPQPPFASDLLLRRPRILLTGPANAGKSALLNAWCGYGRAVVSAMPGTTRDLVAALVDCHGWLCEVFDSAGLRATNDALEAAGQDLAQAARKWVDLVIYVHPADQPPRDQDDPAGPRDGDVIVLGKADQLVVDRTQAAVPAHDVLWQAPFVGDAERSELALAQLTNQVCQRLLLPPSSNDIDLRLGAKPH